MASNPIEALRKLVEAARHASGPDAPCRCDRGLDFVCEACALNDAVATCPDVDALVAAIRAEALEEAEAAADLALIVEARDEAEREGYRAWDEVKAALVEPKEAAEPVREACEKPWEHTTLERAIANFRDRHTANPDQRVRWEAALAVLLNEAQERPVKGAALDGLQQQANTPGSADVRGKLLADEDFLVTLADCDCCPDLIGPCSRSVVTKVLDRAGLQQQEGE